MTKIEVAKNIHARLAWLLERQTRLEPAIEMCEKRLADPHNELPLQEVFNFYQLFSSNYQASLELLRKILVYFPIEQNADERALLQQYSKLTDEQKGRVRELLARFG